MKIDKEYIEMVEVNAKNLDNFFENLYDGVAKIHAHFLEQGDGTNCVRLRNGLANLVRGIDEFMDENCTVHEVFVYKEEKKDKEDE